MTRTQIGVGIIGVVPGRSWSAVAHIPALRSLPQYRLAALSTRRQEGADAAAHAYGIEHAFDNYQVLVSHPRSIWWSAGPGVSPFAACHVLWTKWISKSAARSFKASTRIWPPHPAWPGVGVTQLGVRGTLEMSTLAVARPMRL